jgi:hypothetical protein
MANYPKAEQPYVSALDPPSRFAAVPDPRRPWIDGSIACVGLLGREYAESTPSFVNGIIICVLFFRQRQVKH